jgi:8-oxo-dGTP pyrophosphatase MutT (NUDIX family)
MSLQEKERLLNEPFDKLWKMMWGETSGIQYRNEESVSSKKFETIKSGVIVNNVRVTLNDLILNSATNWNETEWEFPKGRRNYQEKDLDCAIREFEEETGLIIKNSHVIEQHILNGDTELNIDDDMIIVETDKSKETKIKSNILKHSNRKDATERDINIKEKNTKPLKNEHSIYVIENILPLEEIFIGTNNKLYKHKYFLAYMENEDHELCNFQKTEVSKLEWKTLDRCIESIRPYCYEKKKLIRNIDCMLNEYKIYK